MIRRLKLFSLTLALLCASARADKFSVTNNLGFPFSQNLAGNIGVQQVDLYVKNGTNAQGLANTSVGGSLVSQTYGPAFGTTYTWPAIVVTATGGVVRATATIMQPDVYAMQLYAVAASGGPPYAILSGTLSLTGTPSNVFNINVTNGGVSVIQNNTNIVTVGGSTTTVQNSTSVTNINNFSTTNFFSPVNNFAMSNTVNVAAPSVTVNNLTSNSTAIVTGDGLSSSNGSIAVSTTTNGNGTLHWDLQIPFSLPFGTANFTYATNYVQVNAISPGGYTMNTITQSYVATTTQLLFYGVAAGGASAGSGFNANNGGYGGKGVFYVPTPVGHVFGIIIGKGGLFNGSVSNAPYGGLGKGPVGGQQPGGGGPTAVFWASPWVESNCVFVLGGGGGAGGYANIAGADGGPSYGANGVATGTNATGGIGGSVTNGAWLTGSDGTTNGTSGIAGGGGGGYRGGSGGIAGGASCAATGGGGSSWFNTNFVTFGWIDRANNQRDLIITNSWGVGGGAGANNNGFDGGLKIFPFSSP